MASNVLEVTEGFSGLRLTAEEFFELPDDGNRYELVNGVVVMSPSPTPRHQLVAKIILRQLDEHVERHGLGLVLHETDVCLPDGGPDELVYRPEIVFIAKHRAAAIHGRINMAPDVAVEIVSPLSRALDERQKFADYERAGVGEYWLIDPPNEKMSFFRLRDGRYVQLPCGPDEFVSEIVAELRLDLRPIRAAFRLL